MYKKEKEDRMKAKLAATDNVVKRLQEMADIGSIHYQSSWIDLKQTILRQITFWKKENPFFFKKKTLETTCSQFDPNKPKLIALIHFEKSMLRQSHEERVCASVRRRPGY